MGLLLRLAEYKRERQGYINQLAIDLTYQYCEKNYSCTETRGKQEKEGSVLPDMYTVWCCWFQGLDNALEIVKCCVNSIKQLGRKMVLLTEYNVRDYVFLPDYIWIKYREGTILPAHLSDLVRLELLTTRGGIWIDATTWISGTEHILPILDEEPIFMYRSGQVNEHIVFDNWLMQAKVFCKIFETTKEMLLEYWRRENLLEITF